MSEDRTEMLAAEMARLAADHSALRRDMEAVVRDLDTIRRRLEADPRLRRLEAERWRRHDRELDEFGLGPLWP